MADPSGNIPSFAVSESVEAPGLRYVELYGRRGLVSILWHGDPAAERAVLTCGGASGGLLGPARGLYPWLGANLAPQGIGVLRVGYRRPNDIELCTEDLMAAAQLAYDRGARSMVTVGHSFGGAIAVRTAVELPAVVRGVVTLSTQSAGCEDAMMLAGRPLLLFHGERDTILDVSSSDMVRMIAGEGELVVLPGGHMLAESGDEIRSRLAGWIPETLDTRQGWLAGSGR